MVLPTRTEPLSVSLPLGVSVESGLRVAHARNVGCNRAADIHGLGAGHRGEQHQDQGDERPNHYARTFIS